MDLIADGEYDDPEKVDLVDSTVACKKGTAICVKIDNTGGKFIKHSLCYLTAAEVFSYVLTLNQTLRLSFFLNYTVSIS